MNKNNTKLKKKKYKFEIKLTVVSLYLVVWPLVFVKFCLKANEAAIQHFL